MEEDNAPNQIINKSKSMGLNWIDVNDELPYWDTYVLWYREDGHLFHGCIDKDGSFEDLNRDKTWGELTHWCEAPSPYDRRPYYLRYKFYQSFVFGIATGGILAVLFIAYLLS